MKHIEDKRGNVCNTKCIIALSIFSMSVFCAKAQTGDSLHRPAKEFKNSVKLNITSKILYDNSFLLSYERVIKKNQSLAILGGYNEFPVDLSLGVDNAELTDTKKKSGYSLGAEYRFYLSKENKYDAPHGVYLAPFMILYHFNSDKTLTHTDIEGVQSSSNLNMQINFANIGCELGYQFVLGKRWVIDAEVFGPALTHYNFKAKLEDPLPGLDDNEVLQAVIDALKEKLPLLNDISSDQEINKSGREAFWAAGFRYCISIGFRF